MRCCVCLWISAAALQYRTEDPERVRSPLRKQKPWSVSVWECFHTVMMSAIDEHYSHRWEPNTHKHTHTNQALYSPIPTERPSDPRLTADTASRLHRLRLWLQTAQHNPPDSLFWFYISIALIHITSTAYTLLMLHEEPSTSMNLSIAQTSLYSGKGSSH